MTRQAIPLVLVLCLAGPARALMPPHVTRTIPADGGYLEKKTIQIVGYSLQHAQIRGGLRIVDVKTNKPIPWTHRLSCRDEGRCTGDAPPGACQQRCTLWVNLKLHQRPREVRLTFLAAKVTFIAVSHVFRSLEGAAREPGAVQVLDLECKKYYYEKGVFPCRNPLAELPGAVRRMKDLRVLLLAGNRLKALPPWIRELGQLTHVDLRKNPVDSAARKRIPALVPRATISF